MLRELRCILAIFVVAVVTLAVLVIGQITGGRVDWLILPATIVVSVALVWALKKRKGE